MRRMLLKFSTSTTLLVWASSAVAQLPYNPTRLIISADKTRVYQFFAQGSQVSFSYLDVSKEISSSSSPNTLSVPLSFQGTGSAFTPIEDDTGITVVIGSCQDTSKEAGLWRYPTDEAGKGGTWKEIQLSSSDTSLESNYLSAGFSFSTNASSQDTSLYAFGGMCPDDNANATNWISAATYSNTMLSLSPSSDQSPYQLSVTGTRAPPIAEAGLTITPLSAVTAKSAAGKTTQQQNFVLIGGHTPNAFINMSQVALFSLPEASWAFLAVNQPGEGSTELIKRQSVSVEPRSGHTAVLTEDGSKIVVFGGWVGTVTNPATPQLAVLELGQGYGGTSTWQWNVPKQTSSPFSSGQGVYGHGAVMLPGNVMMVSGGSNIGTSHRKRSGPGYMFYNMDTGVWSQTYASSVSHGSGSSDQARKAGLGAGLAIGFIAIAAILVAWWIYRKKQQKKKAERERILCQAFGSEQHQSTSRVGSRTSAYPEMRSASWGSRQEQQIEGNGFSFPWSHHQNKSDKWSGDDQSREIARTGMDVPSPNRGLRKSLSSRGPATYGANYQYPTTGPGSVFRIDEVEEEGSVRSLRAKTESRMSDPFKDPPNLEPGSAAEARKREVQGWVEDWQSAAVNMNLSRNPSHARTYSNLSQAQSSSESGSFQTGRESPEKSDRTGSNLSERSNFSVQRSIGGVSRQMSQRSASAGYTLFANAAAAMGKLSGINRETNLDRTASKRSVSLNTAPQRRTSGAQRPWSGENKSLLSSHSPTKSVGDDSPIKDYKNYARTSSMTSQRRKTGILGSVKRVFTGTSSVDVQAHVEHYEEKEQEAQASIPEPEMSESTNNANNTAFWRGKRGAKDWDEDEPVAPPQPSAPTASKNQTSTATEGLDDREDYNDGDEWDVETAVQKRVVQVMFTVPKEKLRVVNADALSLISRSDVDEREDRERRDGLTRMDSVREDGDEHDSVPSKAKGKAREKAREKDS